MARTLGARFRDVEVRAESVDYHRNGISGEGFHVLTFQTRNRYEDGSRDPGWTPMMGVVFETEKYCAVFDRSKLARGDIRFIYNSFRGDVFEPHLRREIEAWRVERDFELSQRMKHVTATTCTNALPHASHFEWEDVKDEDAPGIFCLGLGAVA